jgi:hypothetical protein
MDGPGTAEVQDFKIGAQKDFEKDKHDDLASISYGNKESCIETPVLDESALMNGIHEL